MKNFMRIPMQFFAEPGEGQPAGATAPADGVQDPTGTAPQGDGQQQTNNNNPAPTGKTFTQEEVDRMISERLARQQKKFDNEKEEAAKLAKMNADQKAEYAAKKREEELKARETAIQQKELRFEALNILEEKGLPSKLVDCLNLTSADTCKASIESIQTAFSEAVTAAVDARLRSNDPPPFSGGNKPVDAFLAGFMEG